MTMLSLSMELSCAGLCDNSCPAAFLQFLTEWLVATPFLIA